MVRFFIITSFFFLFSLPRPAAQVAAGAGHHLPLNGEDASFTRFSLHYQTRLSRVRLEFLPGIHYQKYWTREHSTEAAGLIVPVLLYPLDFLNDCDCPTFSKKGEWFKKGFYFKVTPAWSSFTRSAEPLSSVFSTGAGAGIDFGLSDFITFSPFLEYEFQSHSGDAFWPPHYVHMGFHLLFRPEYKRRRR